MLDFSRFEFVTFDCYGTLIDWEAGLLPPLRALLAAHGISQTDAQVLERYACHESSRQSGAYRRYREVLQGVVLGFAADFGFRPSESEQDALAASLADWPPFPDTVAALHVLKRHKRLAVISNVDDDLFALTAAHFDNPFEAVVTAEQVGAYKPARRNFEMALTRLQCRPDRVLHVAQSLYHDIGIARELGFGTVWVNRRLGRPGTGATPQAQAHPDLELPDLKTFASLMDAG